MGLGGLVGGCSAHVVNPGQFRVNREYTLCSMIVNNECILRV